MYSRILVPLDGSDLAEQALPYVGLLGGAFKIPVSLLNVFDSVPPQFADPERGLYDSQLTETYRINAVDYLEKTGAGLKNSGLTVTCEAHEGNPAEVIISNAEKDPHTLIAMVTHGRSGLGRWVMGSVTDKVLHGTNNPLLITHAHEAGSGPSESNLKNIIVPLDGSSLADQALPHVEALVSALGLNVILVRVTASLDEYYRFADMSAAATVNSGRFEGYAREAEAEATHQLDSVKERLVQHGSASVAERVVSGNTAGAILDLVEETPDSMVAITTHGRSGVGRWVLGSVTDRLVRHSGQPVLVIRTND